MNKKKAITQKEAIEYCFNNCTIEMLGEKNYHKYRSYKRRYTIGETLSYNALHGMFKDFGIEVDCKYYLPE